MIKIESATLEKAYQDAASSLECSITELKIEIIQAPSKGFLGLFQKNAIIVAAIDASLQKSLIEDTLQETFQEEIFEEEKPQTIQTKNETKEVEPYILNDTIMPDTFVSTQDDENDYGDVSDYLADYDDEEDFCENAEGKNICDIVEDVKKEINGLFSHACFKIDEVDVRAFDEETILIEFTGEDAALLIGKEGYRYKALSYMLFNWINTKYEVNLRLEIAEFLKNQEDAIEKYLSSVHESIERDGRAQTKILDGVLVQIALEKLREKYPQKYIAVRSTRDGLKYIIINDYHTS